MKVNILTSPQVKKLIEEELNRMKILEEFDNLWRHIRELEDELTILYGTFDNTHRKNSIDIELKEKSKR